MANSDNVGRLEAFKAYILIQLNLILIRGNYVNEIQALINRIENPKEGEENGN